MRKPDGRMRPMVLDGGSIEAVFLRVRLMHLCRV